MNINKKETPSNTTANMIGGELYREDIGLTLGIYEKLARVYTQQIVDDVFLAIKYIHNTTGTNKCINEKTFKEICEILTLYRNSDDYRGIADMYKRDGGKKFDSNYANISYAMIKEDLKYGRTERIKELEKYIQPGSISADLFCGSPEVDGRHSSVHGSVLLHSLLGVSKVLEIDLFNQENKYQTNSSESEYNEKLKSWNYHFIIHQDVKQAARGDQYDISEGKHPQYDDYIPKIDIAHIKMDALQSLQLMADNSLDSVMINNVDYDIVSDQEYLDELRKELQRVVKKNSIIFGWSSDWVRPKNANIVYGKGERYGLQIIQNTDEKL